MLYIDCGNKMLAVSIKTSHTFKHIWVFADTKAKAKKPKELIFANARQNEQ